MSDVSKTFALCSETFATTRELAWAEIGQYLSCSSLTLFVFAMLTRSSYCIAVDTLPPAWMWRGESPDLSAAPHHRTTRLLNVVVLVWEARGYLRKWSSPTLAAVDAEHHQRTDPITDNYLDKRRRENEKLIRVHTLRYH